MYIRVNIDNAPLAFSVKNFIYIVLFVAIFIKPGQSRIVCEMKGESPSSFGSLGVVQGYVDCEAINPAVLDYLSYLNGDADLKLTEKHGPALLRFEKYSEEQLSTLRNYRVLDLLSRQVDFPWSDEFARE